MVLLIRFLYGNKSESVNVRQAYIGTAQTPNFLFCVKYVSSATDLVIIIIASVVVVSCLVFIVAVIVIYCRHRRQRRRRATEAADAGTLPVAARYTQVMTGRRETTDRKIGGKVHVRFYPPQFDDSDDDAR